MLRGTFQLMKSVNKTSILNKIRLAEPISRAQISKETGITAPTVSAIVKELIKEDLVEESVLGKSKGGRKPTLLLLKRDGHFVIGVDAGSNSIRVVATNLVGDILYHRHQAVSKGISQNDYLVELSRVIKWVLDDLSERQDKVLGIGVAMHGVVRIASGEALYASSTGFRHLPIKAFLEELFPYPVIVENNSRAMTFGEYWFGNFDDAKTLIGISIGRGVGSGIIINGRLRHGAQDIAGEVGHMVIDYQGIKCSCGNYGCWETLITGDAIVRQVIKMGWSEPDITPEKVYQAALDRDPLAIKALASVGRMIGIGIVNLIHIINPDQILLGGGVMNSQEFLMPEIRKVISERALTEKSRLENHIVLSQLKEKATVLGAAAIVLKDLF